MHRHGRGSIAAEWVVLLRPNHSIDTFYFTVAGFAAGGGELSITSVLMLTTVCLTRCSTYILNDLFDIEKDRVTNPTAPLVVGRIGFRTAAAVGATLFFVGWLGPLLEAPSTTDRVAIAISVVALVATIPLYSALKPLGWIASVVAASATVGPAAVGVFAGGADVGLADGLLFLCALTSGLRQNLLAGIRDIDSDPSAGNLTTAARLGLRGTVRATVVITFAGELLLVAAAALESGALAATVMALLSLWTIGRLGSAARVALDRDYVSRPGRTSSIWQLGTLNAQFQMRLVGIYSLLAMVVIGVIGTIAYQLLRRAVQSAAADRAAVLEPG